MKKFWVYILGGGIVTFIVILTIVRFTSVRKLYIITFHRTEAIYHYNDDGKFDGEFDVYLNGKISRKGNFKNGLLDGYLVEYYPSGITQVKSQYKNNDLDGIQTCYYPKGKLKSSESFKNGKADGAKLLYYENGQIEHKSMRKNDKVEGVECEFYENGNLRYMRNWLHGHPYGELKSYEDNKKLSSYHCYDILGDEFYLCRYDSTGNVSKSDGYVFSSRTYSINTDKDSIEVLKTNQRYKYLKDLYFTVATPPGVMTDLNIIINQKLREDFVFMGNSTVVVKNAFENKGTYNISIVGKLVEKSTITEQTSGHLTIVKE